MVREDGPRPSIEIGKGRGGERDSLSMCNIAVYRSFYLLELGGICKSSLAIAASGLPRLLHPGIDLHSAPRDRDLSPSKVSLVGLL